jgi:hypothetical protein
MPHRRAKSLPDPKACPAQGDWGQVFPLAWFDAAREKFLWSAGSQSMDPGSETDTISEFIAAVSQAMAKAGYPPP